MRAEQKVDLPAPAGPWARQLHGGGSRGGRRGVRTMTRVPNLLMAAGGRRGERWWAPAPETYRYFLPRRPGGEDPYSPRADWWPLVAQGGEWRASYSATSGLGRATNRARFFRQLAPSWKTVPKPSASALNSRSSSPAVFLSSYSHSPPASAPPPPYPPNAVASPTLRTLDTVSPPPK